MDKDLFEQLTREGDLHTLSTHKLPRNRKPGTDIAPAYGRTSSRTYAARREMTAFNTYTVKLPTPQKRSF